MLILKLLRVKQWVKNSFVLIPLVFSLGFLELVSIEQAVAAFFAFCFASSFIYIINDIADRKADALHPKKRTRPLASGRISVWTAVLVAAICLAVTGGLLALIAEPKVALVIGIYVLMNIAYSKWLKHIPLVDVFCIAFGFVLRVYAGAYAIGVPVSSYLFMVTLFLSLFLAFGKRKAELAKQDRGTRKALDGYAIGTVEKYLVILAGAVIISYALYTLDANTIARFGNRLIYSVVFVMLGMFQYQAQLDKSGDFDDPTDNLYKDKILVAICATYAAYIMLIAAGVI
ncbi:MAG: UbiA prenyltransferase family protein [Alphaproteobacteria bacterium]|nr:UbiA prenyltransferase family protein [Alphaproteobacteria bacterium]